MKDNAWPLIKYNALTEARKDFMPKYRYKQRLKAIIANLRLASPELAIARVRQRVKSGGHHVSEEIIRRRFAAGLHNFEEIYKEIVNEWVVYDNSSKTPVLIEEGGKR
jgi:predicted ABC-type ATPase